MYLKRVIQALSVALMTGLIFLGTNNDLEIEQIKVEENEVSETVENTVAPEIAENTSIEDEIAEEPEQEEDKAYDHSDWKQEHVQVKGIYVSATMAQTTNGMNDLISLVDNTEINTMVIDVKNDEGEITPNLDKLIKTLKEHDIYTIARIVCFKDPALAASRPELALKTTDGQVVCGGDGMAWVNPYKEEVWEYLTDTALMASKAGFDEVQFDYVRFPVTDNVDYGEDAQNAGKVETITNFLKYATEKLHENNVVVGVDLFGIVMGSEEDKQSVGQDYTALGEVVDVLCPMVYPSHYAAGSFGLDVPDACPYELIENSMEVSKEALTLIPEENCAVVRPWLQSFTATWVDGHITYDSEQINKEIQAVYDSGYSEWILWNASNKYPSGI